ncbi:MAG: hypothetical protein V1749_05050 [Candidatus Desantisbacteria bacterium]
MRHETSDIRHQTSDIRHQTSDIRHQTSDRSSSVVRTGFISVQKRLFLTNTPFISLPLIFCLLSLLLILSSKSAIAYELKWYTAIVVGGQQTNGNYSLQSISPYLGGHSANLTYTITAFTIETLPPQQETVTTFTAIPVSSTMVRLNWNDFPNEEHYTLAREGGERISLNFI